MGVGENATAIKTIAVLILLLLGLGAAAIFSYDPTPNMDFGSAPTEITPVPNTTCKNDDPTKLTACCVEWAADNQINIPTCEGEWSWTELGGCSFTCTMAE